MSASNTCKEHGLKSVQSVADMVGIQRQLLDRWYNTRPKLFDAIVKGCQAINDTGPRASRVKAHCDNIMNEVNGEYDDLRVAPGTVKYHYGKVGTPRNKCGR